MGFRSGEIQLRHEKNAFFWTDSFDESLLILDKKIVLSAMANLSAGYNFAVIEYAVLLMTKVYPVASGEADVVVASAALIGAIVGQVLFGYIGDAYGRKEGMMITLSFVVVGCLASAILPTQGLSMYYVLAICRFILGIGVGGVYPLSALIAAESTVSKNNTSCFPNYRVSFAFSFQGVGQLLGPLISYILLYFSSNSDLNWRILLGIGCLPAIIALAITTKTVESVIYLTEKNRNQSLSFKAIWDTAGLLGSATGWFIFDLVFYGNVIFAPRVMKDTFNMNSKNLDHAIKMSIILSGLALPGYYFAMLSLKWMSLKNLQLQGFFFSSLFFFILGSSYKELQSIKTLLFMVYALSFLSLNFGPNVSTFCLPSRIFPIILRGKMSGISASCGKIGAALGATLYGPMERQFGIQSILLFSAVLSMLGVIVTWKSIPDLGEHDISEECHEVRELSTNLL